MWNDPGVGWSCGISYRSLNVSKVNLELPHRSNDSHHALNCIRIHYGFVCLLLFFRITRFMDDSTVKSPNFRLQAENLNTWYELTSSVSRSYSFLIHRHLNGKNEARPLKKNCTYSTVHGKKNEQALGFAITIIKFAWKTYSRKTVISLGTYRRKFFGRQST